jgi:hypothetical protein
LRAQAGARTRAAGLAPRLQAARKIPCFRGHVVDECRFSGTTQKKTL